MEPRRRRKKHRANSEGSIYHDSDGCWRGALTTGWIGNKPKRKFFRGETQDAVVDKIQEARRKLRLGLLSAVPEKQSLESFLNSWLTDVAKPRVRPKTLQHYSSLIKNHILPALGKVPLVKLTPQHVQVFLASKRDDLSPKTCRHLRTCLSIALGSAVKWNLVVRNSAALTDPPALGDRRVRFLSVDELGAFDAAARGHRLEALFSLALSTGARQAELLGLRWKDIDLENREISISAQLQRVDGKLTLTTPKTRKSRRKVRLCESAVSALIAHRMRQEFEKELASSMWADLDFVFTNPSTGTPIDQRTLVKHFYRIRDAAGIKDFRFHDLRHSCATFLLAQGVPVKMISEILGHSSSSFTMDIYAHAMPKLQEEASKQMDSVLDAARTAQKKREDKEKLSRGAATGAATGEENVVAVTPKAVVN